MTPRVVGIAGGTASGKTTTARAIVERLGDRCLWLTHDRYYRTIPPDLAHDPTQHNFDHPDALETSMMVEHLRALRDGQRVQLPNYDFPSHARVSRDGWDWVEPRPVIVVEGILVLVHPELREQMDHKVFVHAPDDIRLIRRIRRDVAERGRDVSEVLEQYLKTVRPMHQAFVAPSQAHADLVVDGTTTTEAMVSAVMGLLAL